jgi:hypothetical protein
MSSYYAPVAGSYRVTSQFQGGFRKTGGHSGMDFAAPYGTVVRAVVPGRVISAGWSGAYGNLVRVRHADGSIGYYAHHSRNTVKVGMRVGRGSPLGLVGSTGNSTGAHSHFEVRVNGKPVDPNPWLQSTWRPSDTSGNQRATPGFYGGVKLDSSQLRNAQTIIAVGRSMGASERDLLIGLMTAMQESTLENLNYGDRDSLGLFQQRAGWGTPSQRMNPTYAARKFFEELLSIKGRNSMRLTEAAQAVQRSAFPNAYARWEELGRGILGAPGAGSYAVTGYDTFHQSSITSWNNPWEVMASLGPVDMMQSLPATEGPAASIQGGPAESIQGGPAGSLDDQANVGDMMGMNPPEMMDFEWGPDLTFEDPVQQANTTSPSGRAGAQKF